MSEDWRKGSELEQNGHMLQTGLQSDCTFLVGQEPDTKVCIIRLVKYTVGLQTCELIKSILAIIKVLVTTLFELRFVL
jgi:hypothetical protein